MTVLYGKGLSWKGPLGLEHTYVSGCSTLDEAIWYVFRLSVMTGLTVKLARRHIPKETRNRIIQRQTLGPEYVRESLSQS
jgi:hypothetical protein